MASFHLSTTYYRAKPNLGRLLIRNFSTTHHFNMNSGGLQRSHNQKLFGVNFASPLSIICYVPSRCFAVGPSNVRNSSKMMARVLPTQAYIASVRWKVVANSCFSCDKFGSCRPEGWSIHRQQSASLRALSTLECWTSTKPGHV